MTDQYFLSTGAHKTAEDGRCAMEWVAYLAGDSHNDRPVCVSPMLRSFCISFNDMLSDEDRQKLRPYLARTIGTAGDGLDMERVRTINEWLIRKPIPVSLDLIGRREMASRYRNMPRARAIENVVRLAGEARDVCQLAYEEKRLEIQRHWDAVAAYAYAAAVAGVAAYAATAAADAEAIAAAAAVVATYDGVDAAYDTAQLAHRKVAIIAARDLLRPHMERQIQSGFDLLDRLLPKVLVELPVSVCDRVAELEGAA
jgi:hypothetical protein